MIIFLHGDDTFRSREKLRELKEKFLREVDPSGSNLVTIDGTTASASEVWGAIAAQSFLVRKRMVVVERIGAQKSSGAREEVAAFLERIPEDVIAVFWEEKSRAPTGGRGESRGALRLGSGQAPRRGIPVKKKAAGVPATVKRGDPLFTKLLAGALPSIPERGEREGDGRKGFARPSTPSEQATPGEGKGPRENREVVPRFYAQEFAPLEGVALTRWVVDAAKAHGTTLAPDATRDLIAIVGSDLWRMRNEIEKLTMAAAPDFSPSHREGEREGVGNEGSSTLPCSPVITPALVRDLVATVPQEDVFGFVDAIGRGDRATAIRILRGLEAARVDPQYLLAMIHRQLRLLVMAADLLERQNFAPQNLGGLARGTPASRLAVELGVHPFVAQKLSQQARTVSPANLRALYPRLLDLDRKLKSSRVPWEALVELFCLEATTP